MFFNRWINGIPRKHNEEINLSEYLNEPVLLETVNQMQYNRKRYEEYYSDNQVHLECRVILNNKESSDIHEPNKNVQFLKAKTNNQTTEI